MKNPRILFVLTVVNFALLVLTVAQQFRPAFAQTELPVLRGRGLKLSTTKVAFERASRCSRPSSRKRAKRKLRPYCCA